MKSILVGEIALCELGSPLSQYLKGENVSTKFLINLMCFIGENFCSSQWGAERRVKCAQI